MTKVGRSPLATAGVAPAGPAPAGVPSAGVAPAGVPSLGIAVLGLGTAGAAMVAAALRHPGVELVGVADPRVAGLPLGELPVGCARAASLEELLGQLADRRGPAAVHVATPTPLHAAHVESIVATGCNVIVEKPVTATSAEAARLAALLAGRPEVVLVGHSEAFEPYVQAAAATVASGAVGEVQAVLSLKATDWSARPRGRDELEAANGGGLVRRQGVHQMDVVRTVLGSRPPGSPAPGAPSPGGAVPGGPVPGGPVLEVRQAVVRRDGEGRVVSYLAWLAGGDGVSVVVAHEASGGLAGGRRGVKGGSEEDLLAEKWRRAGELLGEAVAGRRLGLGPGDRERLVVLGSTGELVASSGGVAVSGEGGDWAVPLAGLAEGRAAVLDELLATLAGGRATHEVGWGAENLRLCEAIEATAGPPSRWP